VNTHPRTPEANVNLENGGRDVSARAWNLLLSVWFLYLFAPHKLLQFYVPASRPLAWLPELLLWGCAFHYLRSPARKPGYPAFTRFMLMMVLGTVVAYVLGNSGLARAILRYFYQYYLLGLITLSWCTTPRRARSLFTMYLGYFVWFGLWGLISLKTAPLTATTDPGSRAIVYWHPDLDNRDAFGPLMVAGLA
jgi:hypothetical protein